MNVFTTPAITRIFDPEKDANGKYLPERHPTTESKLEYSRRCLDHCIARDWTSPQDGWRRTIADLELLRAQGLDKMEILLTAT